MGLFSSKQRKSLSWIELKSIEELDIAIEKSKEKPVLLFKHSTRCGISSMALNSFETQWNGGDEMDIYYLDLLNYRDISNAIAEKTNVFHQSPQVIVLKNNEVVYTATHSSINAQQALDSIK